jgi:hypothetical protein
MFGPNGSVLLEEEQDQDQEQAPCTKHFPTYRRRLREEEPSSHLSCNFSNADLIQVLATASVFLLGGPVCPLKMGRVDSLYPDGE